MDAAGVGACAARCLEAGDGLHGRILRADLAAALEELP